MSQAMTVGGPPSLVQSDEESVSEWANGKSLIGPELVVEIERITGVSRHDLWPDLSRIFGGR